MRLRRAALLVVIGLVLAVAVAAYAAVALTRRIPDIRLVMTSLPRAFPRRATGLAWPGAGQAALSVPELGLLRFSGTPQPQPIASVAKIMTAFVVLQDHPLGAQASGPRIPVTADDVAVYRADRRLGQSTEPVVAGEELTEREALEGLLLPSANNLATLLAAWDAGSEAAFVQRMNARGRALGMAHTHYADASGFSPATVSTALDQVRLARVAFRNPALAQISALREATLPEGRIVRNLDALLGSHGVVAGKTGTTGAAGGCFVFVARMAHGRRALRVVAAVLGQPGEGEFAQLEATFDATTALLRSARGQLVTLGRALRERLAGHLESSWTRPVRIRPGSVPDLVGWSGLPLRIRLRRAGRLRAPVGSGQVVGVLAVRAGPRRARVPLVAGRALAKPSLGWRLTHP